MQPSFWNLGGVAALDGIAPATLEAEPDGSLLVSDVHSQLNRTRVAGVVRADVESFVLVDAGGAARFSSREINAELFRLAIGGYGLFGVIAAVTLRLAPRRKLERRVVLCDADRLMDAFERRIGEGYEYGDFQFAIDPASDAFLRTGILSSYRLVPDDTLVPDDQKELSAHAWRRLCWLAHADKRRAFELFATHYLDTDGQIYWSDTHQLGVYLDDYHAALDRALGAPHKATEMITEIYVPRAALAAALAEVREDFRQHDVDVVYGTVRLIERDTETFLAWAREPWACIVFNLHTVHTPEGIARAARAFRRLIDVAIRHGGSYYLTYHRWARRDQVETCYPQFREFLRRKREFDPQERFQSEWYRHYRRMFGESAEI